MFESPFDFSRFTVQDSPIVKDRQLDISVRKNGYLLNPPLFFWFLPDPPCFFTFYQIHPVLKKRA